MGNTLQAKIKNLAVNVTIGVYEEEKHGPQPLILHLTIDYTGEKAAQTDNVSDTMDYCELTKHLVQKVESTNFELLERLSSFILDIVMEEPLAIRATVEIEKPGALKNFGAMASVTATRER